MVVAPARESLGLLQEHMLPADPRDNTFDNLQPGQIAILDRLLRAGFGLVYLEKYARYIVVEREGFVALLDPAAGRLRLFSQVGYRMDDDIGMLVDRGGGKAFVCHGREVAATASLIDDYNRFRVELQTCLHAPG